MALCVGLLPLKSGGAVAAWFSCRSAYKFRFYPTAAQAEKLNNYFGAGRWYWNQSLAIRRQAWQQGGQSLTGVDMSRRLTAWKKTAGMAWLREIPSTILTQKGRDLDAAYAAFFAGRGRFPRFKKRAHAQSFRFQLDQRVVANHYRAGERLKLTGLGSLKLRWTRLPKGIPKMVTVSRDAVGDYWVSFSVEESIPALPVNNGAVGIDMGLTDVVVTSDGWRSGSPKHLYAATRRLRHQQRTLSRRRKGSNRWQAQRRRVAKLHRKVARQRQDFLHKISTTLIRKNQAVAMEDLNVAGMMKNHRLARAIGDAGWRELRRQLEYKAAYYGRDVFLAGRFEATSKTCSACGHRVAELPLHIRQWQCPACEAEHDRDQNAAINVLAFATGSQPVETGPRPVGTGGSAGRACKLDARGGVKTSGTAEHSALTRTPLKREADPACAA